ncbi:acyltransferase [Sphingobacterium sp.]|uniref:acyltransferase family protein n=1 Tax=Sphingobacterium sp. TaxID=341027 RepID=UPI00258F00DF|nr:acyltransferase [Sphingobacterium sp.]WET70790.1 MAG: acyltransferase [Sphingobacterium sp.]
MGKDYHSKPADEQLLSKTIDFLRFPLIVGVVFIHTDFSDVVLRGVKSINLVNYPIFTHVFFLFSKVIFEVCVPLFFLISGFLFFYKTENFSFKVCLKKLKGRIYSLFIPYIFWNVVVLLFFFLAQTFLSGSLMSGRNKLVTDYSLTDWLWSFWDTSHINPHVEKTLPVNSPFWFIRDLMVVIIASPLLYFLIKKLKVYTVIFLGILWVLNPYFYQPGLSTVSFFFFAAGAYFSINKRNFVGILKPVLYQSGVLYLFLVIAQFYFLGTNWWNYLYCAGIMTGLVCAVALSAHFIEKEKWRMGSFWTNGSFFVFAYHRLPLVFVIKFLFTLVRPHSDAALLFLYFACPTLIITLGLLSYSIMRSFLPKFTAIICGGR